MRYFLFGCRQYYPAGGMEDYLGTFPSITAAKAEFATTDWDFGQIAHLTRKGLEVYAEYDEERGWETQVAMERRSNRELARMTVYERRHAETKAQKEAREEAVIEAWADWDHEQHLKRKQWAAEHPRSGPERGTHEAIFPEAEGNIEIA